MERYKAFDDSIDVSEEWDVDGVAEGLDEADELGFERQSVWFSDDDVDAFWPLILRVAAVGARVAAPLFRTIGGALGPAAARAAARQLPGVFVRGTSQQVRTFARKVGGRLVGPERHGSGLPHYHLIRPGGDRIHIWFGRRGASLNSRPHKTRVPVSGEHPLGPPNQKSLPGGSPP
jgi:hypothetical protein